MPETPFELRLHHIGYVVSDIAAVIESFVHSLAANWDGRIYEDPIQNAKVTFVVVRPGDALVELVQPATETSPVFRFLHEKGGGFHHVCYEVAAVETAMAELKLRGARTVKRPKAAVAFQGRRIAWMLTAANFLIEVLEAPLVTSSPIEHKGHFC
jgi:methylmalonyl-CoA/ethylmalonyl-CoA epimerase